MAECPVCQAHYVNGKVDRCHVCGWQLSNTGISRLGPFRVEHQVSKTALVGLEAWARHMWATVQQQKNRIAQLQSPQPFSPPVSVSEPQPEPFKPTRSHSTEESTDLIEWIVGCFAQADQERSQLLFQMSQLRAELQRLASLVEGAAPAPPQAMALEQGQSDSDQQAQLTAIQEAQGTLAAEVRQLQQQPPLALDVPSPEEITAQVQPYLENRLATIQTDLHHQTASALTELKMNQVNVMGQIAALEKQHQEANQQWREWHNHHTAEQTQVIGQVAQLQTHQANLANQLTTLEKYHNQLASPMAELEMRDKHHSQQLTDLAHDVRQYQTQLSHQLAGLTAQQQDSTTQFQSQLAHSEGQIKALQLQGEQVLTRQDQQQRQIATLQSQIEMLQTQTDAKQAAVAAQIQQLSSLVGHIDQLESGLAGVQQALQNIPRVVTPSNRSTAAVYTRYQQSSN